MSTYVLGINAAFHESAACLVRDGALVLAVEEERYNRTSHGKKAAPGNTTLLPWLAIDACLRAEGISLADCAHVGYSFDPELLQAGVSAWRARSPGAPSWELPPESYQTLLGGSVFLSGLVESETLLRERGFKGRFHYLPHHDCHAASAFHVSPFERAAVAVIDGVGEWATTSLYYGAGDTLERIEECHYPNSIGFIWEKFSAYLGFGPYDACKVMGLSAYGDARRTRAAFEKLVTSIDPFRVDGAVLRHESMDFGQLEAVFGLPKRTAPVQDAADPKMSGYVDIAAGLQVVTEEVVLAMLRKFNRQEYANLCLAGGVALNCALNGRVLRERLFKNVFVQPAAHDAGTALGAAMLVWSGNLGQRRAYTMRNAYQGPEFSEAEIRAELDRAELPYRLLESYADDIARLIADGNVVGWFNGRMEWGPRALGNRSLLADPRNQHIREIINAKVKHREPFRPFCPSVMAERAKEWFDVQDAEANKYMLTTAQVREDKRRLIPAVVHEDGTARIHEVHASENPQYHRLLEAFEAITGVPVLLNTSFNDSEPIVCTPLDAIRTFTKTRIDYLVFGRVIVAKPARAGAPPRRLA
jgi:carbamoyltransferase